MQKYVVGTCHEEEGPKIQLTTKTTHKKSVANKLYSSGDIFQSCVQLSVQLNCTV